MLPHLVAEPGRRIAVVAGPFRRGFVHRPTLCCCCILPLRSRSPSSSVCGTLCTVADRCWSLRSRTSNRVVCAAGSMTSWRPPRSASSATWPISEAGGWQHGCDLLFHPGDLRDRLAERGAVHGHGGLPAAPLARAAAGRGPLGLERSRLGRGADRQFLGSRLASGWATWCWPPSSGSARGWWRCLEMRTL